MLSRPTLAQRNTSADNQKWESALSFVSAASALDRAIKEHGLMSEEAKQAQHTADVALKRYKKWRVK